MANKDLQMRQFTLCYIPFPEAIRGEIFGMIHWMEDKQRYLIAIDSTRTEEEQLLTLKHELSHARLCHFFNKGKTEEQEEDEADIYAERMSDDEFHFLLSFAWKVITVDGCFDDNLVFHQA